MKKYLALLLAVIMVLSMAACSTKDGGETTAPVINGNVTPAGATGFSVDYTNNTVIAGSVTANVNENAAGGGEVGYDIYAGTTGKDHTDPEVYTLNDYLAGTTNMNWSTHNWETSDDSYVLTFLSSGFYEFVLNSTKDGWSIACEMAAELPVDVTSEFVGKYGVAEGETGKAWKFVLNPNACFADGTPINADTYMYSYKELLNPLMKNRRADSLYAGDFTIYGSKEYVYQGQTSYNAIGTTVADFVAAGGVETDLYVDMSFWGVGSPDGTGYASITDDTMVRDPSVEDETAAEAYVSGKYLYETYLKDGAAYASYGADYLCTKISYESGMDFSEVGIVKTGEYELVFITTQPIQNANYYVPYNMSSTYLVYEPLWESCKKYFDADGKSVAADSENVASITTNYGTSLDTTMSYGPYKMTYFELDKQITFERNEKWYGYSDGKHLGQYQTDIISTQIIGDHATALLAFEKGEIDNIGLQSADMEKYGTSDYIRYTPQSYTTKLSFNTNLDALKARGTGSEVLTNANFRKAFSLSFDRTKFATSYTSAGSAGYGLLNYMYVYDPFTGATYRDTAGAKDALVNLYGLTYGENGEYGDLDEAHDAITGYDMATAKALMATAYDECVAAGLYDGSSEITLQINVYSSDDVYVQMFNFLNDALKEACVGTGFEGKVNMTMVVDADYYETMYSGNTDIIFTTWGGAAYSPYTMLYQCYCDAADGSGNQMEYGFDTTKVKVTINVNGLNYTTDLQTWSMWACGDTSVTIKSDDGTATLDLFNNYDAASRSDLFSKLEYAYMSFFTTTPLYYRNSASLVSQKGDYAVQQYIDLIGFAGIQFYTYNYTDAQWAEVVAAGLTY